MARSGPAVARSTRARWLARAFVVLGLAAALSLAFWAKVEHAKGICDDAKGRWVHGDCVFEDALPR